MFYIDLNGEIIATFAAEAETAARLCFKALHKLGVKRNAYGLHFISNDTDKLLTCSEMEWEAEWEATHEDWD